MLLPNPISFVEEVREFVSTRRDVQYLRPQKPLPGGGFEPDQCKYSTGNCTDGSVGCVIGQTLRFGEWPDDVVTPAGIDELEKGNSGILNLYKKHAPGERMPGEKEAIEWLWRVQNAQDNGATWGHAVDRADDPEDVYAEQARREWMY